MPAHLHMLLSEFYWQGYIDLEGDVPAGFDVNYWPPLYVQRSLAYPLESS
jgi:hypothetical protein